MGWYMVHEGRQPSHKRSGKRMDWKAHGRYPGGIHLDHEKYDRGALLTDSPNDELRPETGKRLATL